MNTKKINKILGTIVFSITLVFSIYVGFLVWLGLMLMESQVLPVVLPEKAVGYIMKGTLILPGLIAICYITKKIVQKEARK